MSLPGVVLPGVVLPAHQSPPGGPLRPCPQVAPAAALLPADRLGDGPPLPLLHGLGSSRRDWTSLQPRLAAHFATVAVDLPGQGEAAPLDTRPTVGR